MILIPKTVIGGHAFTSVSAGAAHTCASTATAVFCWGSNSNGQLGTGTLAQYEPPPSLPIPYPPPPSRTSLQLQHTRSSAGLRCNCRVCRRLLLLRHNINRRQLLGPEQLRAGASPPLILSFICPLRINFSAWPRLLQRHRCNSFPETALISDERQQRCRRRRHSSRVCIGKQQHVSRLQLPALYPAAFSLAPNAQLLRQHPCKVLLGLQR
jgi:hypothetical protein